MASRRVVITGTGLVTPLGTGVAKTWRNICEGASGVDRITRYDATDDPVQIAAEVKDFQAEDHFDKKAAKQLKLFVQYALVATRMALAESGRCEQAAQTQRQALDIGRDTLEQQRIDEMAALADYYASNRPCRYMQ